MKRFLAIAVLSVGSFSTLGAMAPGGAITGYISDTKCAMSGAKSKTAAEWIKPAAFESCVKDCVKEGSEAVFLTEDNKMLKLDAASLKKVTPFLGHKVSVTGKVEGGTIKIDTVTGLKMQ